MKLIVAFKKQVPDDTEWYWKVAAKLTQFGTRSKYFHVELVVDGKWISVNTHRGIEIRDLEPIHNPLYDYYELEVEDLTPSQDEKFWRFIESQVGSGYDWMGIYLTQFINLDWESKSKWFCSEITAKVLQMLYVEGFIDRKPNRLSPQDIFEEIKKMATPIQIEKTYLDTNFDADGDGDYTN